MNCSRLCATAYHNYYGEACAANKDMSEDNLVCADYAQVHYGWSNSCGQPGHEATELIQNMTLLCGCMSKFATKSTIPGNYMYLVSSNQIWHARLLFGASDD